MSLLPVVLGAGLPVVLQDQGGGAAEGAAVAFSAVMYCVIFLLAIAAIAGMWKVFSKAGKPGWAAIIPFYNAYTLMEIVGRPVWWFILLFIPCVNIVVLILVMLDLAKSFGKGPGYGIGLALLSFIFMPMLGFGDATYKGPSVTPGAPAAM